MTVLVILFGLLSGCFLSILVGLVGRSRRLGFGWAFILSLIFTPLVGLICTLISDPLPAGQRQGWGCIGTIVGGLGCLFLILFLLAILTGGTLFLFGCGAA